MGRLKQPSEINSIKEELEDGETTTSSYNNAALACMINSEITAVLAVMRRNVRWGGRYLSADDQLEFSLIHSFKALRKQIFNWKNPWNTINPAIYLQPFLDVICSDETGAPITGVALSSVYKILSLDVLDLNTVNVKEAMFLVVDAVTSCRFEVTDPASEEVVLMKILQVLLACIKNKISVVLSNQQVCNIVSTCFRVVHQSGTKGELLQRIARQTMYELVRHIFLHLSNVKNSENSLVEEVSPNKQEVEASENSNGSSENDSQTSLLSNSLATGMIDEHTINYRNNGKADVTYDSHVMNAPFGVPCMVEIFQFLCSMLNLVEQTGFGPELNTIAFDEDLPLFALGLINSAIEVGGPFICEHPCLLNLVNNELFRNLMQFGLSTSPLILSMVCSIILNLYHYLRSEIKLQVEAFFSCVILRLAQSRYGASYLQQEVAMEALVDFCRQKDFIVEMYINFDCDITYCNIFEDVTNLLSRSAFPVNSPLSSMNILALEGLISVIQGISERISDESLALKPCPVSLEKYIPFWMVKCDDYSDPNQWVPFVRGRKHIKRKLTIGADHFNRDKKKGLEFLQGTYLLPEKLDPKSVACFLRYTPSLDKNLVGDYLGNHDEFSVQVLKEFAGTFDFHNMNLDIALRLFLETFRLPGEAQKIQRILEAFSERYYEQSPETLADKDVAFVLSYSLILLNTDLHNIQVKKKMSEEDFIRNNRRINCGNDLPREFLSELYHSICKNEIRTTPEQAVGFSEMTPSRWINLMNKSRKTPEFILPNSNAYVDYDMFAIISGPAIASISVVFDNAEHEEIYQICIDGFLAIAKISSFYCLENVLDDLIASLCKFTTLLNPSFTVLDFGDDVKARMATITVFTIANKYGDFIRTGWKNIIDCILKLHKVGLLPPHVASDDTELSLTKSLSSSNLPVSVGSTHKRSTSGLIGRFSQLLYLDIEEPKSQPTDEELAAHQSILETIKNCQIDKIFADSKFLQADSVLHLARALIRPPQKRTEDEDMDVLSLELLIAITLNNRDRIEILWQGVYDHITNIVQSNIMPCLLVEKAVFGLLSICQRLLPYKEVLANELLRSLTLVLKLDARVADAYCEQITQEISRLVKANASRIHSPTGWRTITSLLSITARHPEASGPGFDALSFIMSEGGAHLSPINFVLFMNSASQFSESRVGRVDRSVNSLDLMVSSVSCLIRWSRDDEVSTKINKINIGEMWLRLVEGLGRVCLDEREEVRNHAVLSLQTCLLCWEENYLPIKLWVQCFDLVIFKLLDDLLEIFEGRLQKNYRNIEETLVIALKLVTKVFLLMINYFSELNNFCEVWLGVLGRMEKCMKVKVRGKKSEKIHELVPELLKNILLVMKKTKVEDSFWELTWLHVKNISPKLQNEVFSDHETVLCTDEKATTPGNG